MENKPKIGLLMSLYNDTDEARALLETIPGDFLADAYFFNDNSDEDVIAFLRPYSAKFPITVLRSMYTGGFGELHHQKSLQRIDADWVIRMDADEHFKEDNWTEQITNLINRFGDYIDAFRIKNFNFLDGKEFPGFPFNNHLRLFKKSAVYFPPSMHSSGGELRIGKAAMDTNAPTILHMKTTKRQKNAEAHYTEKLRALGNERNFSFHFEEYMRGIEIEEK